MLTPNRSCASCCLALAYALTTLILLAQSAAAVTTTTYFTGTVESANGIWAGQGVDVSGFYTFDLSLVDSEGGDLTIDLFESDTVANQGLFFEISVTVGGVTKTTLDNQNLSTDLHHLVEWQDEAAEDRFRIRSRRVVADDDFARIMLRDTDPIPPDAVGVGSGGLTDIPTATLPALSLFNTIVGISHYESHDATGAIDGLVTFTITRLSATPIPEPGTGLLVGIGLIVLARGRRQSSTVRVD